MSSHVSLMSILGACVYHDQAVVGYPFMLCVSCNPLRWCTGDPIRDLSGSGDGELCRVSLMSVHGGCVYEIDMKA